MTNLAAAVERCYENFAKAIDAESSMAYVITADLETILAELGRGAGEPVQGDHAPVPLSRRVRPDVECAPWVIAEIEKLEARTRPPVAGLSELTDAQILELYLKMDREFNDANSCGFDYKKPVIKAAREFLGKVE